MADIALLFAEEYEKAKAMQRERGGPKPDSYLSIMAHQAEEWLHHQREESWKIGKFVLSVDLLAPKSPISIASMEGFFCS